VHQGSPVCGECEMQTKGEPLNTGWTIEDCQKISRAIRQSSGDNTFPYQKAW